MSLLTKVQFCETSQCSFLTWLFGTPDQETWKEQSASQKWVVPRLRLARTPIDGHGFLFPTILHKWRHILSYSLSKMVGFWGASWASMMNMFPGAQVMKESPLVWSLANCTRLAALQPPTQAPGSHPGFNADRLQAGVSPHDVLKCSSDCFCAHHLHSFLVTSSYFPVFISLNESPECKWNITLLVGIPLVSIIYCLVHITRMFVETHSLSWVYHGFIMGLSGFHHEYAQKVQRQWRSSCSHEATRSPLIGGHRFKDSALGMFNKNRWTSPTIYK